MTPAELDITMVQGSMFRLVLTLKDSSGIPVDVTDWTGNLQVRKKAGSALLVEARSSGGTGGTISIVGGSGGDGQIEIYIPADKMETVPVGKHRWDIELIPASGASDTQQWIRGVCEVLDQVTVV